MLTAEKKRKKKRSEISILKNNFLVNCSSKIEQDGHTFSPLCSFLKSLITWANIRFTGSKFVTNKSLSDIDVNFFF